MPIKTECLVQNWMPKYHFFAVLESIKKLYSLWVVLKALSTFESDRQAEIATFCSASSI